MSISDDSKGYLLSVDLLLALIPLTILIGVAAANMDNMFYLTQNTIFQSSMERAGTDALDTLVETSGVPYDWERIGTPTVAGLAKYDTKKRSPVQNYLSSGKVVQLEQSDVQNLLGPEYGFYLNISTVNNNTTIKTLGTYNSTASNIVRLDRIVISTNIEIVTSLEGLIRDAGQPRTYTTTFQTNDVYVNSFDYWVLVINRGYNSATVDVNNNPVVTPDMINQHIYEIKQMINPLYLQNQTVFLDDIVNVRTVSTPGASMDVYVISAPKGTSPGEINLDNVEPKKCRFQFYIWTR